MKAKETKVRKMNDKKESYSGSEDIFDASNLANLFTCLETSAVVDDRQLFLSKTGSAHGVDCKAVKEQKRKGHKTMKNSDLEALPDFWRLLVLRKEAFADEADYHASIRVLLSIERVISELLKPYIRASLGATKEPGAMCRMERSVQDILGNFAFRDPEEVALLQATFRHPPPLLEEKDMFTFASEMRSWEGEAAICRTFILLAHLDRIGGHAALKLWLERPNIVLGGDTPLGAVFGGRWNDVADLADEMLTG